MFDALKTYAVARELGWRHRDALSASREVKAAGGLKAAAMSFNSGAPAWSSTGAGYWPNQIRKLGDTSAFWANTGLDTTGIWKNSTVQVCMAWIQRTFIEPPFWIVKGEGDDAEEVRGHPLTMLLHRPNPAYTTERMWQSTLADLWVNGRGNAYWRKIRNGAGRVVEVWPIPAQEIMPFRDPERPTDFVTNYRRTVNGVTQPIPPGDIVHFRIGQDPANQMLGWSPVTACTAEVGVLNEGAQYRAQVLANVGIVPYGLLPKDEKVAQGMDATKVKGLRDLFMGLFSGQRRGAGLFVPNFSAELVKMGFSPQELDIRQMLEWDSATVCSAFGLDAMIVGLPAGDGMRTYANHESAREGVLRGNIIPTQQLIGADMEAQLLTEFDEDPDHHVGWDYARVGALQEDQTALFTRFDTAWRDGMITREEAKRGVKVKPMPGTVDKVYLIPDKATLVPADETPEDRAQADAEQEKAQADANAARLEALRSSGGPVESSGDQAAAASNGNGNGGAPAALAGGAAR